MGYEVNQPTSEGKEMRGYLTDKAQRELEELFQLKREAIELLGSVNAEWQSDPQSVQCFDLRIVKRTDEVLKRIKKLEVV